MGKKKGKRSTEISSTPQASDSDTEVEVKKKPKANKGPKSSAELCKEYNIEDVDLEYTEADYQNLTTFGLFSRIVRPQIVASNPKLANSKMSALLEAKWREFQNSNPLKQSKDKQKKASSDTEQSDDADSDHSGPTQRSRRSSLKIKLPISSKKKKEAKQISSESEDQSDKSTRGRRTKKRMRSSMKKVKALKVGEVKREGESQNDPLERKLTMVTVNLIQKGERSQQKEDPRRKTQWNHREKVTLK